MIEHKQNIIYSTTILGIRHKGKVAMGGDGQVTLGNAVMKHSSRKIRKMHNNSIIAGFAGAAADAFTLFERFEQKLERYSGNFRMMGVVVISLCFSSPRATKALLPAQKIST